MTAVIRDKGTVPLSHPDAKIYAVRDEVTGNMAACVLDLAYKEFAFWWQPDSAWRTGSYGNVDLTDAVLAIHDGHAKLMAQTWKDSRVPGYTDGPHFIVIDLLQVY